MILQEIWTCGCGWDDELPDDIRKKSEIWLAEFQDLSNIEVPRSFGFDSSVQSTTLHTFVDASQEAYGAVVRTMSDNTPPMNGSRDTTPKPGSSTLRAILKSPQSSQLSPQSLWKSLSESSPSSSQKSHSSGSSGAGSKLLLCNESLPSSSPQSDDSGNSSQDASGSSWKQTENTWNNLALLQNTLTSPNNKYNNRHLITTSVNLDKVKVSSSEVNQSNLKRSAYAEKLTSSLGNDEELQGRMNTNGCERNRMTGSSGSSNENLTWLANVAVSQSNQPSQRTSESMLIGRSLSLSGHNNNNSTPPHLLHTSSGSQGSPGTMFRPPITVVDPTQRIYSGNSQYTSAYTTTSGSLVSGYSSLYSVPAQTLQLASVPPYAPYYPHFTAPHGYTPNTILPQQFPHIESYSAVLQSMGSHLQHASHSQLPRSPYLSSQVPQYSVQGSAHRSHTPTTSPSQGQSLGETTHSDNKNVKIETDYSKHNVSTVKDEKSHGSISLGLAGTTRMTSKDPLRDQCSEEESVYKVPSGKEGSMKHRILTRPSEHQFHISESRHERSGEPLVKRTKTNSMSTLKSPHYTAIEGPSVAGRPSMEPPLPHPPPRKEKTEPPLVPPHLHYLPHFRKGSIIMLANNELKRVENLVTDDFVRSADTSHDLKIDSSTVVGITEKAALGTALLSFVVGEHKVQVTVEATLEHPFFVFGQGWSSCDPQRTHHRYDLQCQKLSVGDVCISLTHKDVTARAAEISQQQQSSSLSHQRVPPSATQTYSPTYVRDLRRDPAHCPQTHADPTTTMVHSQSIDSQSQEPSAQTDSESNDSQSQRKRRWSAPDPVPMETDADPNSENNKRESQQDQ
ncbi:hypothetical protein ScPMuIL_000471 [Solemya velum]